MAGITSTIPIQVGNTIIQFPNTGASPVWSEAVIEFAQLVATQLQTLGSPYDIAPTVEILTSNTNNNVLLTGTGSTLTFSSAFVRSFNFTYAVFRTSTTDSVVQTGNVMGVYNTTDGFWYIQHEYIGDVISTGGSYITFDINGNDELTFSTVAIGGTYDTVNSTISYSAKTELVV